MSEWLPPPKWLPAMNAMPGAVALRLVVAFRVRHDCEAVVDDVHRAARPLLTSTHRHVAGLLEGRRRRAVERHGERLQPAVVTTVAVAAAVREQLGSVRRRGL